MNSPARVPFLDQEKRGPAENASPSFPADPESQCGPVGPRIKSPRSPISCATEVAIRDAQCSERRPEEEETGEACCAPGASPHTPQSRQTPTCLPPEASHCDTASRHHLDWLQRCSPLSTLSSVWAVLLARQSTAPRGRQGDAVPQILDPQRQALPRTASHISVWDPGRMPQCTMACRMSQTCGGRAEGREGAAGWPARSRIRPA
jgi:hypothetical protein